MAPEKQTRFQRSLERRTAKAERLAAIAQRPGTPWLLGKFASHQARRLRPLDIEVRVANRTAEKLAQSRAKNQQAGEELTAALGEFRRARAGEPRVVPASDDVLQMQFNEEQKAAAGHAQSTEQPHFQRPEDPTEK